MKVILSNFYENFVQNQLILNTFYMSDRIDIGGVYGSFPHSIGNSFVNKNQTGPACLYQGMTACLQKYNTMDMIVLDFGNPMLERKDFHNRYLQVQVSSFGNRDNIYVTVSSMEFMDYLIEKYPSVKILLHSHLTKVLNQEQLIEVLNCSNVYGVISKDLAQLKKLATSKLKIYMPEFYTCGGCKRQERCRQQELRSILEFSEQSILNSCELVKLKDKEKLVADMVAADKEGFAIMLPPYQKNEDEYYNFIFNYFEEANKND